MYLEVDGRKGVQFDVREIDDGVVITGPYPTSSAIHGYIRKIADLPLPCTHPEHRPPMHMVLPPGVYEYVCPGCGSGFQFSTPQAWC